MASPEPSLDQPDAKQLNEPSWFAYVMVSLLLAGVLVSVWNIRTTRSVQGSLPGMVRKELASVRYSEAFTSEGTWGLGQYAPDVPVVSVSGEAVSLREVALRHNVVYLAMDVSPICIQHFPELDRVAAEIKTVGGSMAMIVYFREGDLKDLYSKYQWQFPVYAIEGDSVDRLNARGVPMAMLFRNGVLGDAFFSSSLDRLTTRVVNGMKQ